MSWLSNKDSYETMAREHWPEVTLHEGSLFGRAFALGPRQYHPAGNSLQGDDLAHEAGHNKTYEALGWLVPIAGWFFGKRVRAWCSTTRCRPGSASRRCARGSS
jgi:hypothetical protein